MRVLFRVTLLASVALAASACGSGNREGIQRTIPPVADLRVQTEPRVPPAALETDPAGNPTDAALDAEERYEDDVLVWGRAGWLQVGRICRWAEGLVGDIPDVDCPAAP